MRFEVLEDRRVLAGEFTDLGSLGLASVYKSSVAWGDYDNDGDLDVLLTGNPGGGAISRVYQNTGGTFSDISAGLPGVSRGSGRGDSVAWGDYDNDGDLDILLTGSSSGGSISRVYQNTSGTFNDISAGLHGVKNGSVAWGDYDNDGDLDILLTGNGIARVYENTSGAFTDISAGLAGVSDSDAAWGDYDNDGDLDILVSGNSSRVYQNTSGTFSNIGVPLYPLWSSSVAWGDYDNDGDLDILLRGYSNSADSITYLYRNTGSGFSRINSSSSGLRKFEFGHGAWGDYDNDGDLDLLLEEQCCFDGYDNNYNFSRLTLYRNTNGTFSDISAGLPGVKASSVAWGDYDNDGDLDILVTGASNVGTISRVYRNNSRTANSVPATPSSLTATINSTTSATLAWDASADTRTPTAGLSYNLRVGTTPGGSDVAEPMSLTGGRRKIAQRGLVQTTSWTLENLTPGQTYYWSLQAVDTALAGSPFATEALLMIPPEDFGDAPDSYLTLDASGGPKHAISANLFLGTTVPDTDLGGFADGTENNINTASDDDTEGAAPDDEDVVTGAIAVDVAGTSFSIDLPLSNTTGGGSNLVGWIDFDRDGSFDVDEAATAVVSNADTTATLTWSDIGTTGPDIALGSTFARFRLTTDAIDGSNPGGAATDGEVEDHRVLIISELVTNTDDSGAGSLRDAILNTNATAGLDLIGFSIPGAGPHTIALLSALPNVTDAVIIDGTTESDFAGTPVIELDGTSAGAGANGLRISSGGSTVRGLAINNFPASGIELRNNSGNTVEGNYLGVGTDGTTDQGNGDHGVFIVNSAGNTIGGTSVAARNVISGNSRDGVMILGSSTTNNLVQGNYIGTNAAGSNALPNTMHGVELNSTHSNTLGGPVAGAGNVISGNSQFGVLLRQTTTPGNVVQGNWIGTDSAGTADIGNSRSGVFVSMAAGNTLGGTTAAERNVIAGNDEYGVFIGSTASTSNTVEGNFIGLDATGVSALGNTLSGVHVQSAPSNTIGGATTDSGNVISGNGQDGVHIVGIASQNNVVAANLIGTNAAGTAARPNAEHGVQILRGRSNTIGGTTVGERNIISGNSLSGVLMSDSEGFSNVVWGNFIGTTMSGNEALGNGLHGVSIARSPNNTIGGTAAGAGNVISGNAESGVFIGTGTGNLVQGNTIGGTVSEGGLGNGQAGVHIQSAPGNTIGGAASGAGNLITHNGSRGVVVKGNASTGNVISRNSFSDNAGLGIDQIGDGVTANDANDPDNGPNNLQNFPLLHSVILNGGNLDVTVSVDSAVANSAYALLLEFYIADSSGLEGEQFLGAANYAAGVAGNPVSFAFLAGAAGLGTAVLATATDADGNTSEFSAPVTVSSPLQAAGGPAEASASSPPPLTTSHLRPIVDAALARFVAAGLPQDQLARLDSVTFSVADLPGALLGTATDRTITLDIDAAGYGWFIDATPHDDSEFHDDSDRYTSASSRMDLLTAVMHELGHVVGYDHADDFDALLETLAIGTRRG